MHASIKRMRYSIVMSTKIYNKHYLGCRLWFRGNLYIDFPWLVTVKKTKKAVQTLDDTLKALVSYSHATTIAQLLAIWIDIWHISIMILVSDWVHPHVCSLSVEQKVAKPCPVKDLVLSLHYLTIWVHTKDLTCILSLLVCVSMCLCVFFL